MEKKRPVAGRGRSHRHLGTSSWWTPPPISQRSTSSTRPSRLGSFLDGCFIRLLSAPPRRPAAHYLKGLHAGVSLATNTISRSWAGQMLAIADLCRGPRHHVRWFPGSGPMSPMPCSKGGPDSLRRRRGSPGRTPCAGGMLRRPAGPGYAARGPRRQPRAAVAAVTLGGGKAIDAAEQLEAVSPEARLTIGMLQLHGNSPETAERQGLACNVSRPASGHADPRGPGRRPTSMTSTACEPSAPPSAAELHQASASRRSWVVTR